MLLTQGRDMSSFIQRSSCFYALLLILLASALGACGGDGDTATPVSEPHTWTKAQSMLYARFGHTSTLLPNGKVLVAGGASSNYAPAFASAELYDPSTGTWTETGSMSTPRIGHTATLLPNGDVLVAGGSTAAGQPDPTPLAEIYDSINGTWSATGSLHLAHTGHAAVLLPNEDVLVAGGDYADAAEIYDPSNGTWTTGSAPLQASTPSPMTLLPNGRVLAIFAVVPQLYDPSTNVWTLSNPIPGVAYQNGPYLFNLTSLKDGTVLTAGGSIHPGGTETDFPPVNTAFVYQPSSDKWSATGNMTTARGAASASLLQDGTVLVFGGTSDNSSELYDPSTGTWSATGNMVTVLSTNGTATVLSDGRVLVAGGSDVNGNPVSIAEIYSP